MLFSLFLVCFYWIYDYICHMENDKIQIPEIPIGVLCYVWQGRGDNPKRYQAYVFGKKNGMFYAWEGINDDGSVDFNSIIIHDQAEPIQIKTITKEEATALIESVTGDKYEIL